MKNITNPSNPADLNDTQTSDNTHVLMKTSLGDMEIELYDQKAPVTVRNFLKYTDSDFYSGTIFHRVIPGFMIQGGGMLPGMQEKPGLPPIINEAGNGLSNTRGTVAMARTMNINSAASQFFINVADNFYLDHKDDSEQNYGYCVFGQVISGMETADRITAEITGEVRQFSDVPIQDIMIISVERVKEK